MTDRKTWLLDTRNKKWTDLKANVNQQDSPKNRAISYYDPEKKMIISQRDNETFHFNLATSKWSKALTFTEGSEKAPYGHNAQSVVYFDPVSKKGLLYVFKTSRLWAYAPSEKKWECLKLKGEPMPASGKQMGYLDLARNVFVVIDKRKVWVARYKK